MRLNSTLEPESQADRVLQLPGLGNKACGRFGNQLTMWLVGCYIAENANARIQANKWVGERHFRISTERISGPPDASGECPPAFWKGSFALQNYWRIPPDILDKAVNRASFRRYLPLRRKLKPYKDHRVILHHRRFDVEKSPWIERKLTLETLLNAARKHTDRPISVLTDHHGDGPYKFNAPFIEDFYMMMQADILFCYPQSSFSILAAIGGTPWKSVFVMRPDADEFVEVEYEKLDYGL